MDYYDNVNSTLLALVEPSAQRICEFGCGAGALARAIRARNSDVYYVGVELVEDQLKRAKDVLDLAVCCNLDQVKDWSQDDQMRAALPLSSFDHVIFGDVLEHLYDPQGAMNQAALRLVAGGSALVCIPNVQHWSVFAQLALGSWPQEDAGLFDRTHIRWFTLHDMIQLVERSGLVVETIQERTFATDQGRSILEDLQPLAFNLGVDPDVLMKRGLPFQYVLVVRKAL
jgi:2-polyprenyl-3-methyl-5-hydroxy-6-metoxy-1,4-benzoquinol methylase